MDDSDDGARGDVGVLVSIREIDQTSIRLVFDRVRRDGQQWESFGFSTFKNLPKETLLQMSMSEEDLHSFGLVLAAELCALLERSKQNS
jgi:hypothetical protein